MSEHDARARLAAGLQASLAAAQEEAEPLAYEILEAYVDDELDDADREIVEARLESDPALRAEIEDLQALRAALGRPQPKPVRFVSIGAPWLAAAAALIVAVGAASFWQRQRSAPGETERGPAARVDSAQAPAPAPEAPSAAPAAPAPQLTLNDGDRVVTLAADRTVGGLDQVDPPVRALVADLLTTGRLPAPPADLVAPRGQLLGEANRVAFAVRAPSGVAVRDPRPLFSWTAAAGATEYRVRVVNEALEIVAESDALSTTTWRPAHALPRGQVLQWQVEAVLPRGRALAPTPPEPEARLRVLTAGELAALDRSIAAAGGSSLATACLLARAGLRDEASRALAIVAAANPTVTILSSVGRR